MISTINIGYAILTPEVIRDHWRSQEVKMSSNLKDAPRDPIFGMYTHVISLTYSGNGILIPKCVIGYNFPTLRFYKGHLRSKKVKIRSIWAKSKTTLRDPFFCIHTHMISLMNIGYEVLTSEVIRSHWRSQEVKMRSNLKNALRYPIFGMHIYPCDISDPLW